MSAGWARERFLEDPTTDVEVSAPADVPSLATLYSENFRYVWRCLRSLGVREHELDDAIQDLFLVVQKKLPEFDGRCAPRTWLYAIALRIARRCKERQSRDLRHNEPDAPGTPTLASHHDVEQQMLQDEQLTIARLALQTLDDEKREVFVLSQVEQMSAIEIAEVMDVPVNTVYSRLRAAKVAFASAIQRFEARSRRQS